MTEEELVRFLKPKQTNPKQPEQKPTKIKKDNKTQADQNKTKATK